jgi:hypothetical protein
MGVRPPRNSEQQKSFNAFGERMMGRIYLLWLVGIFIGALSLRIQKYSVGGFEFSIENQDILQFPTGNHAVIRTVLYHSLGSKKTLRGLSLAQLKVRRRMARGLLKLMRALALILLLLPLMQILLWHHSALFEAAKLIVSGHT